LLSKIEYKDFCGVGKKNGDFMKRLLYGVIFLVSMATLIFETVLTRIFSVTMWYHYAFMAISVAMLGMSSGAVKVFISSFVVLLGVVL